MIRKYLGDPFGIYTGRPEKVETSRAEAIPVVLLKRGIELIDTA